jgi:hypothetical protein
LQAKAIQKEEKTTGLLATISNALKGKFGVGGIAALGIAGAGIYTFSKKESTDTNDIPEDPDESIEKSEQERTPSKNISSKPSGTTGKPLPSNSSNTSKTASTEHHAERVSGGSSLSSTATKTIPVNPLSSTPDKERYSENVGKFIHDALKVATDAYLLTSPVGIIRKAVDAGVDFAGGITEGFNNEVPAGNSRHAERAMSFFMSNGWTKNQAAGIVGNLQQESGKDLDPHAKNSIGMYGLAQWDTNRRKGFTKLFKKPIYGSTFEEQLQYIQHELTIGEEKGAGNALKKAKTATEAAMIVEAKYERSGHSAVGKRIANARALANEQYSETESSKSATDRYVRTTNNASASMPRSAGQYVGSKIREARDSIFGSDSKNNYPSIIPGSIFQFAKIMPGVNMNVNSSMLYRFKGMAAEYNAKTKKKIQVNSAFRSYAEQARLHKRNPRKAAKPGHSRHESGLAIDINTEDAIALTKMGLMEKWGFHRPLIRMGETWHIEPVEGKNIAPLTNNEELGPDGSLYMVENSGKASYITGKGVIPAREPPIYSKSNANSTQKRLSPQWQQALANPSMSRYSKQKSTPYKGNKATTPSTAGWYEKYFLGKK